MLAKRIIPCLDVKDGVVVKGVRFRNHQQMGDILQFAENYRRQGADELVFYDISASSDQRTVSRSWVSQVAQCLDIPFCVAGGIRNISDAEDILGAGADKISINSPALENPALIDQMVRVFGSQCVVIGIDSYQQGNEYTVYQYTGDPSKTRDTSRRTEQWIREVADRGVGEIVLNCMNQDGVRKGYDINQLKQMRSLCTIPLVASGGAGQIQDFIDVFQLAQVDAALAASVFHTGDLTIEVLKQALREQKIEVRI